MKKLLLGALIATAGLGPLPAQAGVWDTLSNATTGLWDQATEHLSSNKDSYILYGGLGASFMAYCQHYTTKKALYQTLKTYAWSEAAFNFFVGAASKDNYQKGGKFLWNACAINARTNRASIVLGACLSLSSISTFAEKLLAIPALFIAHCCSAITVSLPESGRKPFLWGTIFLPYVMHLGSLWSKTNQASKYIQIQKAGFWENAEDFMILEPTSLSSFINYLAQKPNKELTPQAYTRLLELMSPLHLEQNRESYDTITQEFDKVLDYYFQRIQNTPINQVVYNDLTNIALKLFCSQRMIPELIKSTAQANNLELCKKMLNDAHKRLAHYAFNTKAFFTQNSEILDDLKANFTRHNNQEAIDWIQSFKRYIKDDIFEEKEQHLFDDLSCFFDEHEKHAGLLYVSQADRICKPAIFYEAANIEAILTATLDINQDQALTNHQALIAYMHNGQREKRSTEINNNNNFSDLSFNFN